MNSIVRYILFEVLVSAGLPVGLAFLVNWLAVKRFHLRDYLGDGQLCLYATTQ